MHNVVIAVALGVAGILQGNDPACIGCGEDAVEPIAVGRRRPRRFVARKRSKRCVDCGGNLGFVELSWRVPLLADNLDDAIALLEAAESGYRRLEGSWSLGDT
jgi:hypothetical protein